MSAPDVLVVDDNPRNLLAIDAALGDFAGAVVTAKSGEDALRALLRQDYAVILLDIQMPGLDGFETARLIRLRDRCKHTPIIFVTAFDQAREQVLRGYQLGAVDFLFKPITPEILRAKVAAFIALRRQVAEIARQGKLLREQERRSQEDRLAQERSRWEAESLRKLADENAKRAEQLALIVAERERAQSELTRVVRELSLADRRKNEFLATLAHELRTPLSPIALGIDLLGDLLPEQQEVSRVLNAMRRQSSHLVRLVDDLLEVARVSRGKVQLQRAPMALAEAVAQAKSMCQPLMEERAHTLDVEIGSEPLYVNGDCVRIAQVIANLLTNAARYTPPGGHIRLSCLRDGSNAVIRVSDNGRGMTSELIARVFEIFEQGDRESEDRSGLGIGLALVKQLVALHGGKVEAHSDGLERGSTFTVTLPTMAEQPAPELLEADQAVSSPDPAVAKLNVLLVEDNEDISTLTSAILRRAGHHVVAAESGQRALEQAQTQHFDLGLIDIGLPDIGGVELGQRLRALCGNRIRLVAVTGYGHPSARREAQGAGFDGYLVKPIGQRELELELRVTADQLAARESTG